MSALAWFFQFMTGGLSAAFFGIDPAVIVAAVLIITAVIVLSLPVSQRIIYVVFVPVPAGGRL